jgi:hypothetical protein
MSTRSSSHRWRWTQGAGSNHKKSAVKPSREALGRSRGGLTSKIHLAADTRCRPIARVTTAGHRHDSLPFEAVMARIRIRRPGRGRPRTRPGHVLGDKAYSSRGIRAHLRRRRISATIPQPVDQVKNRLRRGRKGGRPPAFDPTRYKQRKSSSGRSTSSRATVQWPPATTVRILLPPRVGGLTRAMTDHGVLCLICRSPVRGGACCRRTDEACPDRGLAANRAPSQS